MSVSRAIDTLSFTKPEGESVSVSGGGEATCGNVSMSVGEGVMLRVRVGVRMHTDGHTRTRTGHWYKEALFG